MSSQEALGAGREDGEISIRTGADGRPQFPSTDLTPQLARIKAGIIQERILTGILFQDIIERNWPEQ